MRLLEDQDEEDRGNLLSGPSHIHGPSKTQIESFFVPARCLCMRLERL